MMRYTQRKLSVTLLALSTALTPCAPYAQSEPVAAVRAAAAKPISKDQLSQMLAPIALYPDALLAQVLMAATYPLEVVQAARWISANPALKGKALEDALQKQSWDPSVKALTAVPQVLKLMDQRIDWTQKLGDAFLAQRDDVMNTVQDLRARALATNQLKTTKEQKVVTKTVENKTVIIVEPTVPQTVYVPVYNPIVVYGAWAYPAYPPYAYYPPGYVVGGALAFTAGVAVGAALWGNCNWGRNEININVNQFNSYNRTNIKVSNNTWQHNSVHRKGVPYKDPGVAQRYGKGPNAKPATNDLRGRDTNGSKPGNGSRPAQTNGAQRTTTTQRNTSTTQTLSRTTTQTQSRQSRPVSSRESTSAFASERGTDVRRESQRGAASRNASRTQYSQGAGGRGGRGGGGPRGR
jgi:hypothetical protein